MKKYSMTTFREFQKYQEKWPEGLKKLAEEHRIRNRWWKEFINSKEFQNLSKTLIKMKDFSDEDQELLCKILDHDETIKFDKTIFSKKTINNYVALIKNENILIFLSHDKRGDDIFPGDEYEFICKI